MTRAFKNSMSVPVSSKVGSEQMSQLVVGLGVRALALAAGIAAFTTVVALLF